MIEWLKTQKFKKLYCLPNWRIRENTNMDSFVFCGKNWDWYFSRKNHDSELELFENVELTREYNEEKFIDRDRDDRDWLYLQTNSICLKK